MDSGHFTRSQARKTSLVSDIPSDVEPETVSSGPVRLPVTAAEKLESMPQKLAVPPSAPMEGVDGGIGSESSLFAGVPLSAPGGQIDPVWTDEFHANSYWINAESGCTPVWAQITSLRQRRPRWFAAGCRCCRRAPDVVRRPSTPRPPATSTNLTQEHAVSNKVD